MSKQPRNKNGEWTSGSGVSSASKHTSASSASSKTEALRAELAMLKGNHSALKKMTRDVKVMSIKLGK
jgi:hypothetical protein